MSKAQKIDDWYSLQIEVSSIKKIAENLQFIRMEKTFMVLFLMMGALMYGQSKHFNTKKGYAAQGYDVVAYFSGTAIIGDKALGKVFNGVNYKFSSQENLDAFNADPQKFIPQYGGYCAYAVAVSGKKVNINPETFEIRDNKLYLFYNSGKTNTLELWLEQAPEELRGQADNNWKKLTAQ